MARGMTPEKQTMHWLKSRRLMWVCLIFWLMFSFGAHIFVEQLNRLTFLGFPLGFYMAAQGALVVFVVLIFVFSARQDAIDEAYDAAEE